MAFQQHDTKENYDPNVYTQYERLYILILHWFKPSVFDSNLLSYRPLMK